MNQRARVCGKICHNAKGTKCKCWCGGVFHGKAGEAARAEFLQHFGGNDVPTTERDFRELTGQPLLFGPQDVSDVWRERVADAVAARAAAKPKRTKAAA